MKTTQTIQYFGFELDLEICHGDENDGFHKTYKILDYALKDKDEAEMFLGNDFPKNGSEKEILNLIIETDGSPYQF
jgi:hypothetical protein